MSKLYRLHTTLSEVRDFVFQLERGDASQTRSASNKSQKQKREKEKAIHAGDIDDRSTYPYEKTNRDKGPSRSCEAGRKAIAGWMVNQVRF